MARTWTVNLPELVAKGVAADAREVAETLAASADVPEQLAIRARDIYREPRESLFAALEGAADDVQRARVLVDPVRALGSCIHQSDDSGRPLDRDCVRLAMVGLAQALERIGEMDDDQPAATLVAWLLENCAWTVRELADALQVDERTVHRWRQAEPTGSAAEARLRALYRIARPLRFAMHARGVGQWLRRPLGRGQDGAPVELLADEAAVAELENFTTSLRG